MTLADNFRRTTDVWINAATSGPQVRAWLAADVDANVAEMVAAGLVSPRYRRFVDGVEDAPNAAVILNREGSGSIRYQFSAMAEAATFALNYAVSHSPVASGAYQRAWFFLVNGAPFTNPDFTQLPLGAEIILTNHMAYHRKIDVGGMRISVSPQIIEQTRQAVMRAYPFIDAQRQFITIPGGYVLRGRAVRSGLSYDKKSRAKPVSKRYIQVAPPRSTRRADSRAGEMMTYPALVMRELV